MRPSRRQIRFPKLFQTTIIIRNVVGLFQSMPMLCWSNQVIVHWDNSCVFSPWPSCPRFCFRWNTQECLFLHIQMVIWSVRLCFWWDSGMRWSSGSRGTCKRVHLIVFNGSVCFGCATLFSDGRSRHILIVLSSLWRLTIIYSCEVLSSLLLLSNLVRAELIMIESCFL